MSKLNGPEVNKVVSYIGDEGGYLGGFSYASHADFYPDFCGLDIDPDQYDGTTRKRFIKILSEANSREQSKILQGVIDKNPLHYYEELLENESITEREYKVKNRLYEDIIKFIFRLNEDVIEQGELKHDIEFVKEVLLQADILIDNHSFGSAVDRIHTAVHSYLKEFCDEEEIIFREDKPKIQDMWSGLKEEYPSFKVNIKEPQKPINQTVNVIGKFLENINGIRNNHAYSHPNEDIIEEDEAKFIINLSKIFLFYVDSKRI